jgi:hypothetical protein
VFVDPLGEGFFWTASRSSTIEIIKHLFQLVIILCRSNSMNFKGNNNKIFIEYKYINIIYYKKRKYSKNKK